MIAIDQLTFVTFCYHLRFLLPVSQINVTIIIYFNDTNIYAYRISLVK